jgi:hypothetical protein
MVLQVQNTDDLEILDVRDGLVRQGRLIHTLDRTTGTTRMSMFGVEGDPETEEEYGELHGRVELIEERGGKWTRKLVGAPPSPALARELEGPPIDDAYYPTAIRVGESWTVTGPELRRWMGSDFNATRGELKNTLVAIETLPEETIAVIEGVGEIGGTMPDEDGTEIDFTMTIKATERRSLERAMEVEISGSGSIQGSGSSRRGRAVRVALHVGPLHHARQGLPPLTAPLHHPARPRPPANTRPSTRSPARRGCT